MLPKNVNVADQNLARLVTVQAGTGAVAVVVPVDADLATSKYPNPTIQANPFDRGRRANIPTLPPLILPAIASAEIWSPSEYPRAGGTYNPAFDQPPRRTAVDTFPGGKSATGADTAIVRGAPRDVRPAGGQQPPAALVNVYPGFTPALPTVLGGLPIEVHAGSGSQVQKAHIDAYPERPRSG